MYLVLALVLFFAVSTTGFQHSHGRNIKSLRTMRVFQTKNKVDSVTIEGELKPIANNILVQVRKVEEKTSTGLYIPDSAKERPNEGVVVSAGPGKHHHESGVLFEMPVKAGDGVIYGNFDGTELKYNDLNHQIIKDDDVLLTYHGEVPTEQNVQCVKDTILVKLAQRVEKSSAGIIISTGNEKKRIDNGEVIKVGPGKQGSTGNIIPMPVKAGDNVKFREYAGSEVKLGNSNYMVLRSYDVLAKW